MATNKGESERRLSTGIAGLDELLYGGLVPGRAYLVRGGPGTGKTTLGLQFLVSGVAERQKVLFISFSESEQQIRRNAHRLGLDLDGLTFLDLSPTPEFFAQVQTYDIFSAADVERQPITAKIVQTVDQLKPRMVFIDPMTQLRYLAVDPFQYRRQVLSFIRYLVSAGATVMFTSEAGIEAPDDDLQFLSDGVIELGFDGRYRSVTITKLRGSGFRKGRHAMELTDHGIEVFPRLLPEEHRRQFVPEVIPSGLPELDELLHGGLERGTITILTGPSGVGKTSLGLLFMQQAARRGERSVVYSFEENIETILVRCRAIKIPIDRMVKRDYLSIVKVEPLRHSADEFSLLVRQEVEQRGTRIVMIDSISGYRLALAGEEIAAHLHAVSGYMANMGVTVLLVNEVEHITGEFCPTEIGVSFLADNIIFMRYLELKGQLCRAIGVLKKRIGDFEKTMRQFEITAKGVQVGKALTDLRGILTGTPSWAGSGTQG